MGGFFETEMAAPGELTSEQQESLNQCKVHQRREDAEYLRDHPELTLMINSFLRTVLEESPDDPLTFAQDFFTQKHLEKHILRIDDGGDSSSSGDEIEVSGNAEEKERNRQRVQAMMKDKRKMVARRRRRAAQAKPVMDLGCDSETDEEDDSAQKHDPAYGLDEVRVGQLMKLFSLVDRDHSGTIDSYELSLFAKAFFRTLRDNQLKDEAEAMMEEIDVDKNGCVDKEEYLSYFSLCVGLMDDAEFLPIYEDLLESFEGAQPAESEVDVIPGERLVKLQMLFQGWDPKNTGNVPRDVVFLLARVAEAYTGKDANDAVEGIPEVVSRKEFITSCLAVAMHTVSDKEFDAILDPLLEKHYEKGSF